MQLDALTLTDWRNYPALSLELYPMLNIFLGANGQGKTNLLESIYYLCYGKNFRGNKDRELVRWEREYFRIEGDYVMDETARVQHLAIYVDAGGRKRLRLNGVKYSRIGQLSARLAAVLFTPDDLLVIKGSPSARRRFIDRELDALYPDYSTGRHAYERVLAQRSELLKEIRRGRADARMLVPWNLQLVDFGVGMIRRRLELLAFLVPQARRVHQFLTGGAASFNVTYQSSLGDVLHEGDDAMKQIFMDHLAATQAEEIARGQNLVGPHRDDLIFYEKGVDLRTFGSQGQQRTAILAMKMAAIDAYEKHLGQKPLLLLDDVMSELDMSRQRAVMEIVVKKKIQTFITGTEMPFSFKQFGYDPIFHIDGGQVQKNS
ncbi:MAG: DNA replication/repair protein RecF [Peptococcaceae bacterium]|nr:DNA replication/repair protein RecF [Peptococcaceae bacterium]